jgi:hypothetical protein
MICQPFGIGDYRDVKGDSGLWYASPSGLGIIVLSHCNILTSHRPTSVQLHKKRLLPKKQPSVRRKYILGLHRNLLFRHDLA